MCTERDKRIECEGKRGKERKGEEGRSERYKTKKKIRTNGWNDGRWHVVFVVVVVSSKQVPGRQPAEPTDRFHEKRHSYTRW